MKRLEESDLEKKNRRCFEENIAGTLKDQKECSRKIILWGTFTPLMWRRFEWNTWQIYNGLKKRMCLRNYFFKCQFLSQ